MDPISPRVNEIINYFANLFHAGKSHSTLCMTRSALSSYVCMDGKTDCLGSLPQVRRFMKGVFESRPSLPLKSRVTTWDVNTVLQFLEAWYPHEDLSLKDISLKLAMLLAILSGQRCQTLHSLDMESMELTENKCTFFMSSLLKQSRKGYHQKPLELVAFTDHPELCIINVLSTYLRRTAEIRRKNKASQLLISFKAPHMPISRDTLRRWIKSVLDMAGIDITFAAHSTRSASTTAASRAGVPLNTILDAAGWSRESTFSRFYNKCITKNFGQCILDNFCSNDNSNST